MKIILFLFIIFSTSYTLEIPKYCFNNEIELIYIIDGDPIEKEMEIVYDNCEKKRVSIVDANATLVKITWYDLNGSIQLKAPKVKSSNFKNKIQTTYAKSYYTKASINKIVLNDIVIKDFEKLLFEYLFSKEKLFSDDLSITQYDFILISIKYIQYLDKRNNLELSNLVLSKDLKTLRGLMKNSSSIYEYISLINLYKYLIENIDFTKEKRDYLLKIYSPFPQYTFEYQINKLFNSDMERMKNDTFKNTHNIPSSMILKHFKVIHSQYKKQFLKALEDTSLNSLTSLINELDLKRIKHSKFPNKTSNKEEIAQIIAERTSLYLIKMHGLFSIENEYKKYLTISKNLMMYIK